MPLNGMCIGGLYLKLLADGAIANIYNNIIWNNSGPPGYSESRTGEDLFLLNSASSTINLYNNNCRTKAAPGIGEIKIAFRIEIRTNFL